MTCISRSTTSSAAWETSRYLLSHSTSVSATAAGVASNGCTDSAVTARGKRLPLKDDPACVTWRHVDRSPSDVSLAGHLFGSIAKAEGGCHDKRGAKRS
jgi:hypothetical protein